MKKILKWNSIGVALFMILAIFSGCAKNSNTLEKSSTLSLSITTTSKKTLKSATAGIAEANITITSATISLADLTIEENSGENNQNDGDMEENDGGTDNDGDNIENESEGENENDDDNGKDNSSNDIELEDVFLPGPFILNVVDGMAVIDNVEVYPGTFKQVNFTFYVRNDETLGNHSILVSGEYVSPESVTIPFTLRSESNQEVQLPIAGGGVTVPANGNVQLEIVLDLVSWIGSLDFASAIVTDGKIVIDPTNNEELLNAFESFLKEDIEVDED